jgi:hypothetical protein
MNRPRHPPRNDLLGSTPDATRANAVTFRAGHDGDAVRIYAYQLEGSFSGQVSM